MDCDEYRKRGKEMVDYIADYLENIRSRRVFPQVSPGYMRHLVPESAPVDGEGWEDIVKDIERVIMPGITHWQSPHMHAYFPALTSYPSLLGDMLADAIGCLGFTWASSPACTELETIVMDWLGKMIGLPVDFLHSNQQTKGGGVIQTTASESTFIALLTARSEAIKRYKVTNPGLDDAEINARLVAYCSDQAHSSVEKASLIGLVKLRLLPCDEDLSLRGETLRSQLAQDRDEGFIPFFLCATLGTTGACAFDNLKELGPICQEEDIWVHIDAAYAGTAFLCPEYRHFMDGVEYAQSFAFNPSKWMMVHFDCTAMWLRRVPRLHPATIQSEARVKNSGALHRTFNVNPLYLQHENTGAAIDYMHWQIALSKKFRALKLWFVIRSFGISGLQAHVRKGVKLAISFEGMIDKDTRFEIPAKRHLGMVVFRLKGNNDLTETLLKRLNRSGRVHMVPASFKDKYVIRFTITSQYTLLPDIARDWHVIQDTATKVLHEFSTGIPYEDEQEEEEEEPTIDEVNLANGANISSTGQQRREGMKKNKFGLSLILSNVPRSPRFINGSFAALFDTNDVIQDYAKQLCRRSVDFNEKPIRLSPRKRLKEHSKQYSFDLNMTHKDRFMRLGKQGSLDSKIEEIFDQSYESEEEERVRDGNGVNGDIMRTLVIGSQKVGQTTQKDQVANHNVTQNKPINVNPCHVSHVCVKCGHISEWDSET